MAISGHLAWPGINASAPSQRPRDHLVDRERQPAAASARERGWLDGLTGPLATHRDPVERPRQTRFVRDADHFGALDHEAQVDGVVAQRRIALRLEQCA